MALLPLQGREEQTHHTMWENLSDLSCLRILSSSARIASRRTTVVLIETLICACTGRPRAETQILT
jgi:hypothetical protein